MKLAAGAGAHASAMGVSALRCANHRRFSRSPKRALRKNVRFFANAQQALDAGFRPCKRCQAGYRARATAVDKIACAQAVYLSI